MQSKMTLSVMANRTITLSMMKLYISIIILRMKLYIASFNIPTVSITSHSIATFSITPLNITSLSIMAELRHSA